MYTKWKNTVKLQVYLPDETVLQTKQRTNKISKFLIVNWNGKKTTYKIAMINKFIKKTTLIVQTTLIMSQGSNNVSSESEWQVPSELP